jgi:hypothetical protein
MLYGGGGGFLSSVRAFQLSSRSQILIYTNIYYTSQMGQILNARNYYTARKKIQSTYYSSASIQ